MGECWLAWANEQTLTSSAAKWGLQVVPASTTWKLTGPGAWVGFWFAEGDEKWLLSSPDLGIQDYQITGVLAHSIPGNDRSATVVIKGTNTDFMSACGLPSLSNTVP